ncbi:Uncharacterised protein [Mycobacteroides abscessus subsp. abscessus]|nr:Uncharacterised protein [Mycobacteroides abscessus subsp. abscessus]
MHRFNGRSACRKHWIDYDEVPFLYIAWQLGIVFNRLKCFRIAVKADMPYLGSRDQL